MLVWTVANAAGSRRGLRAATTLIALVMLTGSAQFLQIIAHAFDRVVLPSWALGALELVLLSGFTGSMCVIGDAGARSRQAPTSVVA